jgi:multiple sugar transport system substrate-binding protein
MTDKTPLRRTVARRTLLEAVGGFLAAGAIGGAYLLGKREPGSDWENLRGERLQLWASQDATANGQRRLLIDQWNAWHGEHQVNMVELPPIADLQYSAIHAALQAKDKGVDIVDLDVPWITEFAAAGHLVPFDDRDAEDFHPLATGKVDGELYALPFNTNVGMLYYRRGGESDYAHGILTAKEAEGLRTWDDLADTIGWILKEENRFEGGIAMQLASYEGFTVNVWEYLLANGIELEDEETGRIDFRRNEARTLLGNLAQSLHTEVQTGKYLILPDALQHNEDESLAAFQNGDVPFLRHWPQAIRTLECGAFTEEAASTAFEVGVVPMPGGVLGGGSLAVSAYSKYKHVSRDLVRFLTGPASQQLLFERGGFAATRHEPYYDAMAQIENGIPASGSDCETVGGPRSEAEALHLALTAGKPGQRPRERRYTQFSRAFRDVLHPKLSKDGAPELDDLAPLLEKALEGK